LDQSLKFGIFVTERKQNHHFWTIELWLGVVLSNRFEGLGLRENLVLILQTCSNVQLLSKLSFKKHFCIEDMQGGLCPFS
jgi:hypothetical protein